MRSVSLVLFIFGLANCSPSEEQRLVAYKELSSAVTDSMCGSPNDRAHGISSLAALEAERGLDEDGSSDEDEVYSIAADLAAHGCPSNKRG